MTPKGFNVFLAVALTVGAMLTTACNKKVFRYDYSDASQMAEDAKRMASKPYLKAHFKNGNLCVFGTKWNYDDTQKTVSGIGELYDFNRSKLLEGPIVVHIDSVAIFESNQKIDNPESGRLAALTILTAVDGLVGTYCITNPKACYGSCPTFYVNENDMFHYSDAEGFSSAIAPSMEYGDVDALKTIAKKQKRFAITMRNEALETHCINELTLLACPVLTGETVLQSNDDHFYLCGKSWEPSEAMDEQGYVTEMLAKDDLVERSSLSDPKNMSSKEEVLLTFDGIKAGGSFGFSLDFRQTLMTTYLIYNAIAFMGKHYGEIFAAIERGDDVQGRLKGGVMKELGNIDVYVWDEDSSRYIYQSGFFETGPIAVNRQMIPLHYRPRTGQMKIKLVLNKGLWRIDRTALVEIKDTVQPYILKPVQVLKGPMVDTSSLYALEQSNRYLVSMPGESYKISFDLPDDKHDYQLFLYSKGYYLEWMRREWLQDQNLLQLKSLIDHPDRFLKRHAPIFKGYEKAMEQEFWNSRIDTKSFSRHGQ